MEIFPEALQYFQKLLRFDTANPPGNELESIKFIADVLRREGLSPQVLESANNRANLVVRIPGDGSEKPLLITSHVDVVHVEAAKWKYPPFSGTIAEDCVWGRGAIDMKNMTTYCLATMIGLAREKTRLKRDVIMSVVADEEVGGEYGMGFLAQKYRDLIKAEYALGELGGYTMHIQGRRIYPIQVGEKGTFWVKVRFSGEPGHGSIPNCHNAHHRLARFLDKLDQNRMPFHMTKSAREFLSCLASELGVFKGLPVRLLQTPLGPKILKRQERNSSDPERFAALAAMVTNTINPTGVESGRQHNVVPSSVYLKLDCRTLPGFSGKDVIKELEQLIGEKLDYEVLREASGHENPSDTPLFKLMKEKIEEADPGAKALPILTVGFTDAYYLNKLGVTCYGFTPVKLPENMSYPKLYHGHNERIPLEGFKWGLDVFTKTVKQFCSKGG